MPSVTYKNQPAIDATGGTVPLEGTKHLYKVTKVLWPGEIERVLNRLLIGRSVHACCGLSHLGDVRVDMNPDVKPDVLADAAALPFADSEFESVLCDPPYNGVFQWNHDLLGELVRIVSKRIVFQHWFIPANPDGSYRKDANFQLTGLYAWQPKTYFGRVQMVSVFDKDEATLFDPPKRSKG